MEAETLYEKHLVYDLLVWMGCQRGRLVVVDVCDMQ